MNGELCVKKLLIVWRRARSRVWNRYTFMNECLSTSICFPSPVLIFFGFHGLFVKIVLQVRIFLRKKNYVARFFLLFLSWSALQLTFVPFGRPPTCFRVFRQPFIFEHFSPYRSFSWRGEAVFSSLAVTARYFPTLLWLSSSCTLQVPL